MSAEKNSISEVKKVIQDVRASWWEDGLVEVMSGCIFVFMAVCFLLIESLSGANLKRGLEIGFTLLLIIFAIRANWVKRYLKRIFIWPKTGYSQPQLNLKSKIVFSLVFILIIGNTVLSSLWPLYQSNNFDIKLPDFFVFLNSYRDGVVAGLVIFLVYFSVYLSIKKKRFLVTGILGLCAGITAELTLTMLNPHRDTILYVYAIILATIGIYSLSTGIPRFLRFRKASEEG